MQHYRLSLLAFGVKIPEPDAAVLLFTGAVPANFACTQCKVQPSTMYCVYPAECLEMLHVRLGFHFLPLDPKKDSTALHPPLESLRMHISSAFSDRQPRPRSLRREAAAKYRVASIHM